MINVNELLFVLHFYGVLGVNNVFKGKNEKTTIFHIFFQILFLVRLLRRRTHGMLMGQAQGEEEARAELI